jgi:transposase
MCNMNYAFMLHKIRLNTGVYLMLIRVVNSVISLYYLVLSIDNLFLYGIINVTQFMGWPMSNKKEFDQNKLVALKSQGSFNASSEKVNDPLFLKEVFFDPNDIVQVKYELLRRVQVEGMSVTESVKNFGFSRLSFYRILVMFEKLGLCGLIPQKRGPKEAHKITANILTFMERMIQSTPSIKSNELKKSIQEKFGLSVHKRSIERALSRKKRQAHS